MKKTQEVANERLLFGAIFGLALVMRFVLLGAFPLREWESQWAYQAWELWQGQRSGIGYETGYLSITRALFALLGSTDILARLWPAVVGSLLVWVPYFFRAKLGTYPALVAAVGFAVDPGFVISSRSVGSPLPALVFLMLTAGWMYAGNALWAGVCAAFFLLSGSGMGTGLVILGVTLFLNHVLGILDFQKTAREIGSRLQEGQPGFSWQRTLLVIAGVLLFFGTSFFTTMEGVSAWAGAIPAFLRGWGGLSAVSAGRILVTFFAYQPLPILFGIWGMIQGFKRKNPLAHFLSFWFVVALFLILVYPSRHTWDLIWVLAPLWGLTGLALRPVFRPLKLKSVVWTLALLILILMSLMWLSFLGLAIRGGEGRGALLQWIMVAAALILGLLSVSLVTAEWSWEVGKQGLVIGLSIALGLYMLSGTVSAAYLRPGDPRTLWLSDPGSGQLRLIIDTLEEVSVYHTGREDSIEIVVDDDLSTSLQWALRNFPQVRYETYIDEGDRPPVLITDQEVDTSSLSQSYLGQDFVYRTTSGWAGALPGDWKKWLAFREGELEKEYILVWIRRDVYPGAELLDDGRPQTAGSE
ncbi:MAG: hypothetical protein R6U57_04115 [Anaerolineales bacterium]